MLGIVSGNDCRTLDTRSCWESKVGHLPSTGIYRLLN